MTIVIQQNTATLAVTSDGNKPYCQVNASKDTAYFFVRDDTKRQAITIIGTVQAAKAPADSIGKWDIGFIQLINESVCSYYFAGSNNSDGSMIVDLAQNPSSYFLDCEEGSAPFKKRTPPEERTIQFPGQAMKAVYGSYTDDQPYDEMSLTFINFATDKDNYLIRAQKEINFYTAFVARERSAGPFGILAYVTWHAAWDFNLTRRLNTKTPPVVSTLKTTFTADPPVRGAPLDKNVARQIANASPSDEIFNVTAKNELLSALRATADTKLVKSFDHWDARVNAAPRFIP
jgi:hypothetical protein